MKKTILILAPIICLILSCSEAPTIEEIIEEEPTGGRIVLAEYFTYAR